MLKKIMLAIIFALSPLAIAAELKVSVEVPKLNVAEYHAPYTAIWIESVAEGDKKFVKTLSVWYDVKKKNDEGQKWLKDIRQWWRRDGRNLDLPIDGVSGATKLSGVHEVIFNVGQAPLTELPAGNYQLFVEMSREVGGREVVKVPFTWPAKQVTTASAQGATEVGKVDLTITP
jgi:hypothetical protein